MKILGIDPAFTSTGMALATMTHSGGLQVEKLHLFRTAKSVHKTVRRSSDDLTRARMLQQRIVEVGSGADVIMVEVPQGSQSARAAWALGIVVGVLSSIGPFIEVTAREVKLATVGKVSASKQEMIKWAMDKHPEADGWIMTPHKSKASTVSPMNEHLADAVAVVYAGMATPEFNNLRRLGVVTSMSKTF